MVKEKRSKMPFKVRYSVWLKYSGSSLIGECYACNTELDFEKFEVGHDKPRSKGGFDNIVNLRPICPPCNKAIGNRSTIEAFRKKYFSGIASPIPPKIMARSVIANIDLVISSLNEVESETLITLLETNIALRLSDVVEKVQFAYVLGFLDTVPGLVQNWLHRGRKHKEITKNRKRSFISKLSNKNYNYEDNWEGAADLFNSYTPLLQELLEVHFADKHDSDSVISYLFVDGRNKAGREAAANRDMIMKDINSSTNLDVPSGREIDEALQGLKDKHYVEQKNNRWSISVYFHQLWLDRRTALSEECESKRKEGIKELQSKYGEDYTGGEIELSENYMKEKYGSTILDFYLLLPYRRLHKSKAAKHNFAINGYTSF